MSVPPSTLIPSADRWGPFAEGLDPAERCARLRTLRSIVHLLIGPRAGQLRALLKEAESDAAVLPAALKALDALAPLDRRRVLASYAAIERPSPEVRR
ncbi:conserved protein of unknown function [Methylorubrum extorquens]|uniref:Uncharacterized protein n=1 Tax=Methylorubrum extorquens TaxID=408 RepID=A0A2N9ASP9_METEX|nr:conserved protein of unknown function [Methylorubrum extorquens]